MLLVLLLPGKRTPSKMIAMEKMATPMSMVKSPAPFDRIATAMNVVDTPLTLLSAVAVCRHPMLLVIK